MQEAHRKEMEEMKTLQQEEMAKMFEMAKLQQATIEALNNKVTTLINSTPSMSQVTDEGTGAEKPGPST